MSPNPKFDEAFAGFVDRFEFLDRIEDALCFSQLYVDVKTRMGQLEPLSSHYLKLHPNVSVTTPDDPNDETDIREIAKSLAFYVDASDTFEETLELQMETLNEPPFPMTEEVLNARECSIIGPLAQTRALLYEFLIAYNFNVSARQLLAEASKGDDGAFFKLVRIDKTVLATPLGAQRIKERQYRCDWAWFRRLSLELAKKPFPREPLLLKAIMLTALFWDVWFSKMTYSAMVDYLVKQKVIPRNTRVEHFRKMLNRAGLKKPRYNKKK